MLSFLKLIRYQNLLMIVLTMCLVRYALLSSFVKLQLPTILFVCLVLAVLCISAGGYIINDIFDLDADKINKPEKVYITESISVEQARFSYWILTLFGLGFGIYTSVQVESFVLSLFFMAAAASLFFYSRFLKRMVLIGNVLIGVLVALPIILVYIFETLTVPVYHGFLEVLDSILTNVGMYMLVLYYAFFSFLTTLVREIIKDVEDINGDHAMEMKTLPILLGTRRARNVSIVFAVILVISLIGINNAFVGDDALQLLGIYNYLFLVVPLLYFVFKLWNAKKRIHFSGLSRYMKWVMLTGILSMLLFKF